jgi:3-hydroxyisobutyrate dehydrogenase-like beta-hydroxyacid dehydrogenase
MRIGYLGVGNMGLPMAGKLLDAGHELWVYDVRDDAMRPLLERQARQATSPKGLADTCETVIVALPTLEIFQRALSGPDGLLAGKTLKTLVNTCTVGGPFVRKVETECLGSRGRHAGRHGFRQSSQGCRSDAGVPVVGKDDRRCRRQAGSRADDEAHQ